METDFAVKIMLYYIAKIDLIFKMYKKKDGGKKVKTKLLDGILKGPGKLALCCLTIVR